MKKYDASQTRIAAIRSESEQMFAGLDLELFGDFSRLKAGNREGIAIEISPQFAKSTRREVTAGSGVYEWEDLVVVRAAFKVTTGDAEALEEGAARWCHDLERAVERRRHDGTSQIDNDECEIEVHTFEVSEQGQQYVLDKNRGAVILTLTAKTYILWK